ncbi:MAG TPA: Hsp20/alpha crystallin family protein [Xanthomonadales bacterium]|nr:Hsp20/alpha crystallin family protein [Xanthomonadales bacterium]
MNLIRHNPMRDFTQWFEDFDRPFWGEGRLLPMTRADWMPSVDINESKDEFLIKMEIPEVRKEDLKIHVDNGMLTVSGERKHEKEDKKQHRTERFYGSFSRSFSLPENVSDDAVTADQKDGMLYLHLKKAEKSQAKAREIKIS